MSGTPGSSTVCSASSVVTSATASPAPSVASVGGSCTDICSGGGSGEGCNHWGGGCIGSIDAVSFVKDLVEGVSIELEVRDGVSDNAWEASSPYTQYSL